MGKNEEKKPHGTVAQAIMGDNQGIATLLGKKFKLAKGGETECEIVLRYIVDATNVAIFEQQFPSLALYINRIGDKERWPGIPWCPSPEACTIRMDLNDAEGNAMLHSELTRRGTVKKAKATVSQKLCAVDVWITFNVCYGECDPIVFNVGKNLQLTQRVDHTAKTTPTTEEAGDIDEGMPGDIVSGDSITGEYITGIIEDQTAEVWKCREFGGIHFDIVKSATAEVQRLVWVDPFEEVEEAYTKLVDKENANCDQFISALHVGIADKTLAIADNGALKITTPKIIGLLAGMHGITPLKVAAQ